MNKPSGPPYNSVTEGSGEVPRKSFARNHEVCLGLLQLHDDDVAVVARIVSALRGF